MLNLEHDRFFSGAVQHGGDFAKAAKAAARTRTFTRARSGS